MKQINFKQLIPHLVAIGVFLLVTLIVCKPALEPDVVLQQGDYSAADAMKHQSELYLQQHGVYPLWVTSMFSGMPAYQIVFGGVWSPFTQVDKLFQLWLPKPMNFFFLACICFYILCLCIRIKPYIGILGSIAFAFCSYNPIITVAGHDTKMLALAYAPALIGGILLLFNKKYIQGFVLTALFATLHLMQNHQQISYYTFLIIGIMGLFYLVNWIKEKDFSHILKVIPLSLGAAVIGIMVNAVILFPVMDYAKDSKRGGQLVMDTKNAKNNSVDKNKTVGLSKEYAFQWSYGRAESMSLLFPGITGYGTHFSQRDDEYGIFPRLSENSNVANYLSEKLNLQGGQADNFIANLSTSIYWGDKPFTSGSVYLGASICFLFILGLFLPNSKHKWWILTATAAGIILAMGKNLPGINNLLFDYLPLYNKFRTPEMALVIPQIVAPLLAVLAVQQLLDTDELQLGKSLKMAGAAMAVIFAVAGMFYFSFDYSKENKERTEAINALFAKPDNTLSEKYQEISNKYEAQVDNKVYENLLQQTQGDTQTAKGVLNALRKDRAAFFGKDILHSLLFVALTIGLIALYRFKKVNTMVLLIGLPLLTVADLVPFDMNYINDKSFENAEKYHSSEFPKSDADAKILEDKDPNFRVFNLAAGDPFQDSKTSYYHKSIGGYHPAKLGIYDDLITYQLSAQPNINVLNMLNTKYVIQRGADNKTYAQKNEGALGNCWFVKGVKFVGSAVDEMRALDNLNTKDSAVMQDSYKSIVKDFTAPDSLASIKQVAFDNMAIKYESNSNSANLAVFSEIYFKDWKAYIDGKEAPIAKANYVLRALVIPAGKHQVEFKFEPAVYNMSKTVSTIGIWLLVALLLAFIGISIKNGSKAASE